MITYITHNDGLKPQGGCGQGHIECTYQQLVDAFGPSNLHHFDEYKSDAEWQVFFSDGTYATIYNYKNGQNYLGKSGPKVEDITSWNIGGSNKNALSYVHQVIDGGKINAITKNQTMKHA